MYFEDLTPYRHLPHEKAVYVGWLDVSRSYNRGPVPEGFLDKLKVISKRKVELTCGHHVCEFCEDSKLVDVPVAEYRLKGEAYHASGAAMGRLYETGAVGNGEIRVLGKDGVVYAGPAMLHHYIAMHQYLPPQEFIDAVMNIPQPEVPPQILTGWRAAPSGMENRFLEWRRSPHVMVTIYVLILLGIVAWFMSLR